MKKLFLIISLLILFLATSSHAHAAAITVNTTVQSPGITGDCTLGEAIQAANTDTAVDGCLAGSGADTITLPAGIYTLDHMDYFEIYIGPLGFPKLKGNLAISGAGAHSTIIQRHPDAPNFRIFFLQGDNITLQGMTISGGTQEGSFVQSAGIGIEQGGSATLNDLYVANNHGIGINSHSNLTLTSSEITQNESSGLVGGSAHAHPLKTIQVFDSQIHDNGDLGIYAIVTDLTLHNTTVLNNAGHGISISIYSRLSLLHSTVAHNDGSGITKREGGYPNIPNALYIESSSIFDNLGRGVEVLGTNNAVIAITNSTLARNKGALSLDKSTARVSIVNSTLAFNRASPGGGILHADNKGSITLLNTILAKNKGKVGTDCSGKIKSLGYNTIGDLDDCTLKTKKTDQETNPRLGAWTDDSTPGNGHYPLLSNSPAINHANASACPTTDQLGTLRGTPCDIGAIEYQP